MLIQRLIAITCVFTITQGATLLNGQSPGPTSVRLSSPVAEVPYRRGFIDLFLTERMAARFRAGIERGSAGGGDPGRAHDIGTLRAELQRARDDGKRLEEGQILYAIAKAYSDLGEPDSAIAYAGQALQISRTVQVHTAEIMSSLSRAGTHLRQERYAQALEELRSALAVVRRSGSPDQEQRVLRSLSTTFGLMSESDSAYFYSAQAYRLGRERRLPVDSMDFGDAIFLAPEVRLGLFHRYLDLVRIHAEPALRGPTESQMLYHIGIVQWQLSRTDSALSYYRRALVHEAMLSDPATRAMVMSGLGLVHADLGRADSARHYFQAAMRTSRDSWTRRMAVVNLGTAYTALGKLDSARVAYEEGLRLARQHSQARTEMAVLNNLGIIDGLERSPRRGLEHFHQALRIGRAQGYADDESAMLHNIGAVHEDLQKPDSALRWYRESLLVIRERQQRRRESIVLASIGSVHRAQGNLARAHASFDSAASVLSLVDAHLGGDENRISAAEQNLRLFNDWALVWLARAPEVGSRTAALRALAALERGRGQALLDLLRAGQQEPSSRSTAAQPRADAASEGAQLVEAVRRGGAPVLSYALARDTLLVWLVTPAGEVSVFRQAISADVLAQGVAELRTALRVDEAARGQGTRATLTLEEPLPNRGFGFGSGSGSTSARPLPVVLKEAAQVLLPREILSKLPASGDLVLIPQGVLGTVPFAALLLTSGESLGSRYALRYAPSLAALAEVQERPVPAGEPGARLKGAAALVVGNPAMPRQGPLGGPIQLDPLPGAAAEGRWLANTLGTAALTGTQASEAIVRERMGSAQLVHLATHAYAYSSEARARQSFIALAPDSQHDGLLTVGEVLDELPRLSADLVVLSACQTGLGNLKQAEGTVGLQRAFLAKGARSVLVSLWSVSDEATEKLMRSFYTHWLSGSSKAEALRKAQEEVRSIKAFEHPRYWAAFQLVGAR